MHGNLFSVAPSKRMDNCESRGLLNRACAFASTLPSQDLIVTKSRAPHHAVFDCTGLKSHENLWHMADQTLLKDVPRLIGRLIFTGRYVGAALTTAIDLSPGPRALPICSTWKNDALRPEVERSDMLVHSGGEAEDRLGGLVPIYFHERLPDDRSVLAVAALQAS
jgi:hypothetical protein